MNALGEWAVKTGGTRSIEHHNDSKSVANVHSAISCDATDGKVGVIPYYAAVSSSGDARETLFGHYAEELAPRFIFSNAGNAFAIREVPKSVEASVKDWPMTSVDVAKEVSFLCTPAASQAISPLCGRWWEDPES